MPQVSQGAAQQMMVAKLLGKLLSLFGIMAGSVIIPW